MRRFFILGFAGTLCIGAQAWAYNPISPEKKSELLARSEASPLERQLADIVKRQQDLLGSADKISATDLTTRLSRLAADYADLLRVHPDNVPLLLCYGKFLRAVGEDERAMRAFQRAVSFDESAAVAYQQMGNILAEDGRYAEAWPMFLKCLKYAPDTALYFYQAGELIHVFKKLMVEEGLLGANDADRLMQQYFARACDLDPNSETLAWRHAQSFYDVAAPDWKAALAAWDKAAALTHDPVKAQMLRMHRARCFVETGDKDEARALLEQDVPEALRETRDQLRARIKGD